MTSQTKLDIQKYSNILVFSISLIPLILFLYVVWNRLFIPDIFGWGESAGLNQILRITSGNALYVRPTLEFTPLVYTPLYYYIAAGISKIIGDVLLSARILSVVSVISSVFLITRIVQKETRNALLGWIAGMIYLACFALSDGFFDIARVDSLYILVVLITFNTLLNAKDNTGYLLFGILLVIGFFIKQSFLILFFPLQVFLIAKRWKMTWITLLVEIVGLFLPLFLFNRRTDGWLFYYLFELPKQHGYSIVSAVNFWIGDTMRPLGILFAFGLIYLLSAKLDLSGEEPEGRENTEFAKEHRRERWWIFTLFFLGAAGASWITRSSNGGGVNNNMPIYAALAIAFGLGVSRVIKSRWVNENSWAYAFVYLVISIQFFGLIYNPFNFIPTSDELRLNSELKSRIDDIESQVFIPYRSHLSAKLERDSQIHMVNLFELTGYFGGKVKREGYELVDQIRENICRQAYGLVILDQPVPWFEDQLAEAYSLEMEETNRDHKTSELLSWQQGFTRTYIPKDSFSSENCLNSIPSSGIK